MTDRVQIGPNVDAKLWKQLRKDVKARKGAVRGNLGDELDNAIRQYLRDGPTQTEQKMLDRLQRIEQALGTTSADGGTDTLPDAEHTHTPTEKPAANAATERKVKYLAQQVRDDHGGSFDEVARSVLVETVKRVYDFRRDTAKRYVERLTAHFDLREHPVADNVLVTPTRYEELIEQQMNAGDTNE